MLKLQKWMWLVLVIIIAASAIAAQTTLKQTPPQPTESETIRVENSQRSLEPQPTVNQPLLSISPEILFTHVRALTGQRYTVSERAKVRNYLLRELKKLGWETQTQNFQASFHRGTNIIATRRGRNPNLGNILVSAHFDTVANSPGADDNASGVAVGLEIARLFANYPSERTLQLAFFDSEEVGLLGSRAFAAKTQFLKPIDAVINMDMVGYACYTPGCQAYPNGLPITPPNDKGDFLVVVGDTEHLPLLNAFASSTAPALEVFRLPVPFKGALTPDTMRSDHAPFWYAGKGAVLITDTANLRNPHYHQNSDRVNIIDRPFFIKSAQLIVNTTLEILNNTQSFATPKPVDS